MTTCAVLPGTALADEESTKLESHGKALRYTLKTKEPQSSIDTGGAAIFVNAPIDDVRKIVTDYRHYEKIIKPFKQSKLLSRSKGVSEIYFEVPILHGAATVWVVTLIGPPVKENGVEKITAKFQRGNVDDFRAVWHLKPIDATHTIVKLELLVDPKMPVPGSVVTPELTSAADKAVTAVRERAQEGKAKTPATTTAAATTTNQAAPIEMPAPEKQANVATR